MVFQNYAVFPHMTVRDNIGFGLRMTGADRARIARQVDRAAALLHIEPDARPLPGAALRRSAPTRRGRPRAGRRAGRAADGRAAFQPRCAAAARDARGPEIRARSRPAPPPSTSPTTRPRRWAWPTASPSCTAARIVQIGPPTDIYRHPATRFVGSFVGSPPMNFLTVPVHAGAAELGGRALSRRHQRRQHRARPARRGRGDHAPTASRSACASSNRWAAIRC